MKPQDLKSPFKWHQRHVLIQDRVWYIPTPCAKLAPSSFTFPGWHHPHTFDQQLPICVEYCSGNGDWVANKAKEQPHQNWVAVELKFERVRKIWSKIKNHKIPNLLAVCGEGYYTTQQYFPKESVQAVFVNFPDPWPKTRHIKHRIVHVPFIKEMERILKVEGTLTVVTDDAVYSDFFLKMMSHVPGFTSHFAAPYYVMDYPDYGTSYFGDLWRQQAKTIRYHIFRKTA